MAGTEQNPFEWIDEAFFEKILRKSEKDGSIQVQSIQMERAGKEGEHFGSVMFRVIIKFTSLDSFTREKSLIVKTLPSIGPQKEILDSIGGLFETEIKMYSEVIPRLEGMLDRFGDNTSLGGQCLYSSLTPEKVLVFEDLTAANYKAVSEWGGNFRVTKKTVEKIARIHALTFKIHKEGGKQFQSFSEHLYSGEVFPHIPLYKDGFKNFMEMLKSHKEFEEFIPKFEKIIAGEPLKKTQKLLRSFFNGLPANVCVLNHGDFHIKNVMLLESDSGELEDVKLVDFQLSIFGPAAIDLIYMFYTFLDENDRIEKRDEILKYYFDIFTNTLRRSGFTGNYPRMSDFKEDFVNFKEYELMIAVTLLPMITELQRNKSIKPEQLNTDEFRESLYKSPVYIEFMKKALPEYLKMGLLD